MVTNRDSSLHPQEDFMEALDRKVECWEAYRSELPAEERAKITLPEDIPKSFLGPYINGDKARCQSFNEDMQRVVKRTSSLGFGTSPELGDGGLQPANAPLEVIPDETAEEVPALAPSPAPATAQAAAPSDPPPQPGSAEEDRVILKYLRQKVDPLFVPMTRALVRERPDDVKAFVIGFLSALDEV